MRLPTVLAAMLLVACMPATARSEDGPVGVVARAVEAMAPEAVAVPGGFRFAVDDVVVSVLTDDDAGLLRVVAWDSDLGDPDVRLVAKALSSDMLPDLGARLVSVRGLLCAAVLAPLRGLTDARFRGTVDGVVRMAREAAAQMSVQAAAVGAPLLDRGTPGLAIPVNLPVHSRPASR
ncbi:MAG TPA: hypothetical protein VIM86_00740 [Thermodesulfobacteriota bacterium]